MLRSISTLSSICNKKRLKFYSDFNYNFKLNKIKQEQFEFKTQIVQAVLNVTMLSTTPLILNSEINRNWIEYLFETPCDLFYVHVIVSKMLKAELYLII